MGYEYDHDCPFEAFITNLGKYNEGELVGEYYDGDRENIPDEYRVMNFQGSNEKERKTMDYENSRRSLLRTLSRIFMKELSYWSIIIRPADWFQVWRISV